MKGWPPRFCAACGARVRRVREEGQDRHRCPRCGWTFYGNPIPAAVAIVTRGRSVLLTRRARPPYAGTWDLPGGFLEAGETPEAAIRRELHEELGVATRRATLLTFVTDRYGPDGFPLLTIIYRVTVEPGPLSPADDVSEARWFPRDRLPLRAIAFPSMRRAIAAWARGAATGRSRPSGARSS